MIASDRKEPRPKLHPVALCSALKTLTSLCMAILACTQLNSVQAAELFTTSVRSTPSRTGELDAQMLISTLTQTNVPQDGIIEVVFPPQVKRKEETTTCYLLEPPDTTMAVTCRFEYRPLFNPIIDSNPDSTEIVRGPSELLTATITGMDKEIDGYFQIKFSGIETPRSTSPTDSFRISTFDESGTMLDFQNESINLIADQPSEIPPGLITSSSNVVAEEDQTWDIEFISLQQLKAGDQVLFILPKWDKISTFPKSYFSDDALENGTTCLGSTERVEMTINCEITKGRTFDSIKLTNPFETDPTLIASDGSTYLPIQFSISKLRNPMSGKNVQDFQIVILDSKGGRISEASASLRVNQLATGSGNLELDDYQVNALTNYNFEIISPVPIEAGCMVEIFFPSEVKIDDEFTYLLLTGAFGEPKEPAFQIIADTNSVLISKAYESNLIYSNSRVLRFVLGKFKNPWYVVTPEPVRVVFSTADENPIFQVLKPFTTAPGQILSEGWPGSIEIVDEISNLLISIQPQDPTYSEDAKLVIEFPQEDFPDPFAPCALEYEYTATLVNSETITCETLTSEEGVNSLVMTEVLTRPYEPNSNDWLDISVDKIRMPASTRPTGIFKVFFYDKVGSEYKLVDYAELTQQVTARPGIMEGVLSQFRDPETYKNSIIDFEMQIKHIIPAGGSIFVQLPHELQLMQDAKCLELSQAFFSDETTCVFSVAQNSFNIVDPLARERTDHTLTNTDVSFTIEGIRSQRASRPSSPFKFESRGKDGYMIDTYNAFYLPAPPVKVSIDSASLTQSSVVVGDEAVVEFTFKSPVPLVEGDLLLLSVPPGCQNNLGFTFRECRGSSYSEEPFLLASDLYCLLRDDLSSIQLTISLDDREMQEVPIGSQMMFQVHMLVNPGSTKPSIPFQMRITDSDDYFITALTEDQSYLDNLRMKAELPAEIYTINVAVESKFAFKPTVVKFAFAVTHALPANAIVDLIWPPQMGIELENVEVWSSRNPNEPRQIEIDEDLRRVRAFAITDSELDQGQIMELQLKGMINSRFAAATDSFIITTRLDEVEYVVDQRDHGLEIELDCDFPCTACLLDEPSTCRNCDTSPESDLPYYYDGQCLVECPQSFLPLNFICNKCDENCLECEDMVSHCSKCHPDMYLQGNTCLVQCPDTHHPDPITGECIPCEYPCLTCSGSTSTCTSCSETNLENYYFDGWCYEECPVDISVDHQGECVACDDNCLTCAETWQTCTSCSTDIWLDTRTARCFETCPADVSVPTVIEEPGTIQNLTCAPCTENCLYCNRESTEVCEKCREGFNLYEASRECVETCPARTHQLYVSITDDNLCLECADGCSECQYSSEHCMTCEPTHVFYDFQCLQKCPPGFELKSAEVRECVRVPGCYEYGYEWDVELEECVLAYPHCDEGFILNNDLTLCIPLPTWHAPFVFLYAAIIWTGLILMNQNRQNYEKEVIISQLLIGYTAIQQITYAVLWFLSFPMGYPKAVACHTIGLFAVFFLNLTTLITVLKLIDDRPFRHWRDRNHKASVIFIVISALYSFKAVRLFICELFQKQYFNAAFEDKYRTIIRPMFIVSMVGLLQVIPVGFVDAYTIWQIEWGYELKTLAIENLILAVLIFLLEIYEFNLYKDKLLPHIDKQLMRVDEILRFQAGVEGKQQAKIQRKERDSLMKSEYKVMGALAEDEDDEMPLSPVARAIQTAQGRNSTLSGPVAGQNTGLKTGSQIDILDGLIRQMDEKRKINDLNRDLDVLNEAGKQAKEDADRVNSIGTSIKVKRQLLNEKRKKFESHRNEQLKTPDFLELAPEMPFADNGPTLEEQRRAAENVEQELASLKGIRAAPGPILDSISEGTGSPIQINMKVKLSRGTRYGKRSKQPKRPLEIYETRSEDEKERDQVEYERFLQQFKLDFDARKARHEIGQMIPRETESFDENLNREIYDEDNCAVASDFHTELSWVSYPPTGKGYWVNNPPQEAKFALFAEKIKSKFQYCNVGLEKAPEIVKVKRDLKMSRRTQTLGEVESDFDPFESDNDVYISEGQEDEEELSEVDPSVCRNIFAQVLDGVSDSQDQNKSAFEFQESEDSDALIERTQADGKSRKRARAEKMFADDVAGELSVDSAGQIRVQSELTLRDKAQQQVSKKGYLVDDFGNILDKNGNIVFARDEISEDGDIPDRLRQEHRKKVKLQGQQKADLTVEQYMQDQRLDELKLLDKEEAVIAREMDKLKELSMDAPTELDASEIAAAEKAASDEEDEKIHEAFEVTKQDSVHEQVMEEFKIDAASPKGKKGKTELEKAYRVHKPAQIFDKKAASPKVDINKKKKIGTTEVTMLDSEGASARLTVEHQASGTTTAIGEQIGSQVPEKGKYQATDDGSRLGASNLPFQQTQGNISSSEVETHLGGQTTVDAKKFLMMYESDGSRSQNQVSPLVRGAMTVGQAELPNSSDFDTSGRNQFVGQPSEHNVSMPTVQPRGEIDGQLSDTNFPAGMQFMRDSLPGPGDLDDRQKFDKFKYGYMFDFHKPQTPRDDTVRQSSVGRERDSEIAARPKPFTSLGPDLLPFKAKKKSRDSKQVLQDQRRIQMTCGSERIKYLENIYLKKKARAQANNTYIAAGVHQKLSQPPQLALTTGTKHRHYNSRPNTALNNNHPRRRRHYNNLKKQNFVEDGMNIMMNAHSSLPNSHLLDHSQQQMQFNTAQPNTDVALQSHVTGIGLKKELNVNGAYTAQQSMPQHLDNYFVEQAQTQQPIRVNNTLNQMINGNTSVVSSIAPLSDGLSPERVEMRNNFVSDMQSAFNNLRRFDSDDTNEDAYNPQAQAFTEGRISAGGQKLEETIDSRKH